MSKSLGNTIDPNVMVNKYGADILRLWVASCDYQADVRVSEEIVKQNAETYKSIRNRFKFMLGTLADFDYKNNAGALVLGVKNYIESLNKRKNSKSI